MGAALGAVSGPLAGVPAGRWAGWGGLAEGGREPCGSADRTGPASRSRLDRGLVWEPPAVRRRIHRVGQRRGDRGGRRFGTPLDRRSIRNEVVLAKWLRKPTSEHATTQSRLGRREHAAPSISPENSRAISYGSPRPAGEPWISDRPTSARRDLKPERSSALEVTREGRACDPVVTRLEASPLGRGTVVRAAAPQRALVNPAPRGISIRRSAAASHTPLCGSFPCHAASCGPRFPSPGCAFPTVGQVTTNLWIGTVCPQKNTSDSNDFQTRPQLWCGCGHEG